MNGLEIVLIILVLVWTLIFALVALMVFVIFLGVKRAIKKANNILDETEDVAKRVDLPSKIVMASILGFMAKSSFKGLKDLLSNLLIKGKKNKSSD